MSPKHGTRHKTTQLPSKKLQYHQKHRPQDPEWRHMAWSRNVPLFTCQRASFLARGSYVVPCWVRPIFFLGITAYCPKQYCTTFEPLGSIQSFQSQPGVVWVGKHLGTQTGACRSTEEIVTASSPPARPKTSKSCWVVYAGLAFEHITGVVSSKMTSPVQAGATTWMEALA